MINPSAAAEKRQPAPSTARWPMTRAAWDDLDAEIIRLASDLARLATGGPGEDTDGADAHLIELPVVRAAKRLERLRAVRAAARVVDEPGQAVIGRDVVVRDGDGGQLSYTVVNPGEGDPARGWISADSPLGKAILGQRAGATVELVAPAGRRQITVDRVG